MHTSLVSLGALNIRLASRPFSRIMVPLMVRRCFGRHTIMLDEDSFALLLAISQHPVFGPTLDTLVLDIRFIIGPDDVRETEPPRDVNKAYDKALEERDLIMQSGFYAFISQTIAAFPNLASIEISSWSYPWGGATRERQLGWPFLGVGSPFKSVITGELTTAGYLIGKVINRMNQAVAESGIALSEFWVNIKNINPTIFHRAYKNNNEQSAEVETLNIWGIGVPGPIYTYDGSTEDRGFGRELISLIGLVSGVLKLDLNFEHDACTETGRCFANLSKNLR